jgi:hypothetical protein
MRLFSLDNGTMLLLVCRVAAAPLLILCASMAQRRYGQSIGGRLVGLPLTSLPLLALMTAADGRAFAAAAATATLAGVFAQSAWCWVYAHVAVRHLGVWSSFLVSSAVFALTCVALYGLHLSLFWGAAVGSLSILAALAWWPSSGPHDDPREGSHTELAARMSAGCAFTVGVTEASRSLGPSAAGLVGAYPVLTVVLAVATHRRDGDQAASVFLRGVIRGSGSLVAGVATIALTIGALGPVVAFPLAITASLAAQFVPTGWVRRPAPAAA